MMIYIITLGTSWTFDGFLEKVTQLGWLGTPTKSFSSNKEELEIECIIDYGSS